MTTFRTAAQRRASAEPRKILWPDTEEGPYEFKVPTTGQLAYVGAYLVSDEKGKLWGILMFLKGLMSDAGYAHLEQAIRAGDIDPVVDILEGDPEDEEEGGLIGLLMREAAADRPTQPSSGSSASRTSSGARSTGRSPGTGSTLSS